jgi:hypothetical protein
VKQIHYITSGVIDCCDSYPNGLAIEGWYVIENGHVLMTTETGIPTGARRAIKDGESARTVAVGLIRDGWFASDASRDFNRPLGPLDYPKLVY